MKSCTARAAFYLLVKAGNIRFPETLKYKKMEKNNNPFGIPDLTPMLEKVSEFVKDNQGEKGFIKTYEDELNTIYGYRHEYNYGETILREHRIVAVAYMDNELCVLMDDNMVDENWVPLSEYTEEAIKEHLDEFESVRWSDIMYIQTIFNIAKYITEYAD